MSVSLRGLLRRGVWVHVAVTGLLIAAAGAALVPAVFNGTAGTFTVESCEPGPTTQFQTTRNWDCDGTFVGDGGSPRRDWAWTTISQDPVPQAGHQARVLLGAEWWRQNYGVTRAEQIGDAIIGLCLIAAGGALAFFVIRHGLRLLPERPRARTVRAARFLAELPLILAPAALVTAGAAALAHEVGGDVWFVGIFTYVAAVIGVVVSGMVVDLDPPLPKG